MVLTSSVVIVVVEVVPVLSVSTDEVIKELSLVVVIAVVNAVSVEEIVAASSEEATPVRGVAETGFEAVVEDVLAESVVLPSEAVAEVPVKTLEIV